MPWKPMLASFVIGGSTAAAFLWAEDRLMEAGDMRFLYIALALLLFLPLIYWRDLSLGLRRDQGPRTSADVVRDMDTLAHHAERVVKIMNTPLGDVSEDIEMGQSMASYFVVVWKGKGEYAAWIGPPAPFSSELLQRIRICRDTFQTYDYRTAVKRMATLNPPPPRRFSLTRR